MTMEVGKLKQSNNNGYNGCNNGNKNAKLTLIITMIGF